MNNRFGELFVVPKPVKEQHEFFNKEQGLRIKDLQNPSRKMSKSDETGKGIIFLGDSPEAAAKKIKSAETDSLGKIDPASQDQPGIANLLQTLALATNRSLDEVTEQYQGQEQYGQLKSDVAEAVASLLTDFQARLAQVDEAALMAKLEKDEAELNQVANDQLLKVQRAVGLR
jgi:tryptophanyl-tRNA synthetase